MVINPIIESYTPEVIDNNVFDEGILLNVGFNPYEHNFVSPLILMPGTSNKIGMKNLENFHVTPKYPIFPTNCIHDAELKILKGMKSQEK